MKMFVAGVFVVLLLLAGCCSTIPSAPVTQNSNSSKGQQAGFFNPGDSFIIDTGDTQLECTIIHVRSSDSMEGTRARQGAVFAAFDMKISNIGKKSISIGALNMKAYDNVGRKYDVAGGYDSSGRIFNSDIEPGLTGTYTNFYVEVPDDISELQLQILGNDIFTSVYANVDLSNFRMPNTGNQKNSSSS